MFYNVSMSKPQEEHFVEIPQELLEELLTPSEMRMVKQRIKILRLISQGQTIRAIAEQVGVGTDTVVRMARKLEGNPKLQQEFKKFNLTGKQSSKWVFGEVGTEEKL